MAHEALACGAGRPVAVTRTGWLMWRPPPVAVAGEGGHNGSSGAWGSPLAADLHRAVVMAWRRRRGAWPPSTRWPPLARRTAFLNAAASLFVAVAGSGGGGPDPALPPTTQWPPSCGSERIWRPWPKFGAPSLNAAASLFTAAAGSSSHGPDPVLPPSTQRPPSTASLVARAGALDGEQRQIRLAWPDLGRCQAQIQACLELFYFFRSINHGGQSQLPRLIMINCDRDLCLVAVAKAATVNQKRPPLLKFLY